MKGKFPPWVKVEAVCLHSPLRGMALRTLLALPACYAEQGLFCNGRPMVSVFLSQHGPSSKRAAGCLLLWAQRAGHINRSLQQRRAAGECGQCHVVSARKIAEHRRFLLLCQSARRPPPVGKRSIAIYMSICGCRASGRARIS